MRAGPRTLSEREAHSIAEFAYDYWLKIHKDNPSKQPWKRHLGEKLFIAIPLFQPTISAMDASSEEWAEFSEIQDMEGYCTRSAEGRL